MPAPVPGVASSTYPGREEHEHGAASMGLIAGLRTICFPSSDAAFATDVDRSLAAEDVAYPWQLENALRPRYPSVQVRVREIAGEPGVTWYVYRDQDFTRWPAS
jgi:hypothetical protein